MHKVDMHPNQLAFALHISPCGHVWHAASILQTVTRLSGVIAVADGSPVPVALASHALSTASW